MSRLLRCLVAAASLIAFSAFAGPADSLAVVAPRGPGRYAVGCSNIEQDFSRVASDETAAMYWEGIPGGGRQRYVTDLLTDPADTPTIVLHVPNDFELFGFYRDNTVPQVLLVCYPTSADNPRAGFTLPSGKGVPHMQRGAEAPLLADDAARYPLMLFSHGLGGSPLSADYLDAIVQLAANGYVVVAPFHADARVVNFRIEDLNDLLRAIVNFPYYTAMQAVRPLALQASIDYMLGSPVWGAHIDASRIVGFGGSLGGESLMLLAGAKLTTTPGLASKQVTYDPRLKAAVGYVPYFGQELFPAFGRDQNGVDVVTTPYLAVAGSDDNIAPLSAIGRGMVRMKHSRELVELLGVGHYFDRASAADIFTWSLDFLDAYASGSDAARAQLQRMTVVAGGGDDRLLIDYTEPAPPKLDERITVEYYNAQLDHYFITAEPAEIAMLDEGVIVPGWQRTGYVFKTWSLDSPFGDPVCRFTGTPGIGPSSHFFTVDPSECALVRTYPLWTFEGLAFRVLPALGGTCPADRMLVIRLYNNGKGGQANHRYLTSYSEITRMVNQGWIVEGPVFCTPP